jgi:hypothetical protein
MHPSSTLHPPFTIKKIDFTSETLFCLKSIFLSKRGGQMEDEGRIFIISRNEGYILYSIQPLFRPLG